MDTLSHNPEQCRTIDATPRQAWMAVLARASHQELQEIIARLPGRPAYTLLRAAESGAIMVRARAGGSGRQFNLGEASVTRCTIRLADGTIGISYALGRDRRRAELAAVLDGLLQGDGALNQREIVPLAQRQQAQRHLASRKAAATKVDFFTMVRGEG